MRTFRHRTTVLAAAATAALTLTLTACGGEDGTGAAKAAGTQDGGAPAASASATPGTAAGTSGTSGTGGSGTSGTGTSGTSGATGTSGGTGASKAAARPKVATTPACTPKDVTLRADRQDGPPYTHIVLTAKNTSGRTCRLDGFPEIQFLESHRENVPAVAKSKPPTPVVLAAGDPAYALVRLSDGGVHEDNEPVSAFSVTLRGSDDVIAVRAPGADGIAVDPAKWKTGYWTYELRNGADEF
ncbi:DUF4232 domain-containing protein [Streptomyces sp. NPDC085614]|uniref:DUF4232 domain-containing protein n=1 Tax=Streptomyces sp. NPDC085614 TaxID=3365733 RepID=UPI0037D5A16C